MIMVGHSFSQNRLLNQNLTKMLILSLSAKSVAHGTDYLKAKFGLYLPWGSVISTFYQRATLINRWWLRKDGGGA